MTIRFTKNSTESSIKLATNTTFRNWDPKADKDKPTFNFNASSNGKVTLGNVQEKLLQSLAGGHYCDSCDDPDDLCTLTEQDLKEAHKRYLNKDKNLFGDIKAKTIRYDEYHGAMTIITDKGDVLNVDLLTESEKRDGVDSSKGIFKSSKAEAKKEAEKKTKNESQTAQNNQQKKTQIVDKKSTPAAKKKASGKKDIDTFLIALGNRESSGDHTVMNKYGYVGLYQVGEEALHDVGVYYETKKTGINYKKNDWVGYVSDKNKYGITSLWDFMHSRSKQKAVQIDFKKKHWQYLMNLNLIKYIGKTINGIPITQSGLLAGAHLVGPGGIRDFLRSNGKNDVTDANGTPVSSYIKNFAGYDIAEITSQ